VSGSQVPFHTACDGWKPIPAPVGAYFEKNRIETQDGYSNVQQGPIQSNSESLNFGTKYNVEEGSIIDGLSDEQLVAVALQGDSSSVITGAGGDGHLNTIESDALQVGVISPLKSEFSYFMVLISNLLFSSPLVPLMTPIPSRQQIHLHLGLYMPINTKP